MSESTQLGDWKCQCGEFADPSSKDWRRVNGVWEHFHEYPVGYIKATRMSESTQLGDWKCDCGEFVDPASADWRWNGSAWEHHHNYPMGHVMAKYIGPKPKPSSDAELGKALWEYIKKQLGEESMPFFLELDTEELLVLAEKHGRAKRVPYDPDKHGNIGDVEPGDEIWWWGDEL